MISTGLKGLDKILSGLRAGDNVVWQIDDLADYKELAVRFVNQALVDHKRVVYMRFAPHEPLLKDSEEIKVYRLDPNVGFESFATKVNEIIAKEAEGVYYVFDCLSSLLSAWANDLMIGNFFMVTCPFLFELDTIAYFSLLRNRHSYKAVARIRETTQLLLDVYSFEGSFYIHPLKVWNRYSQTMFLPHVREKEEFLPVTDSVNAAKLLSYISSKGAETAKRNLDYWDRLFLDAEEMAGSEAAEAEKNKMVEKLCSIMFSRNKNILALAAQHLSLEEIINIKSRSIGTGFIGGKSAGMLLARKIISDAKALKWKDISEPHDSFYIGSDFFYSYLIENHLWRLRVQQKSDEGYFALAPVLKEKMLYGTFPEEIKEKFRQVIEYFGASPIIVRSSSLLEDGFGNAFAGKYDSVFLANQGTPEERYIRFAEAVKKVYASTMSEDALVYRKQRGLDKLDEQMALLVQRVSGAYHGDYFFPDLAGVGISYNTYVWNSEMDPRAGMLRLVFGLGTRSVNRVEGDYPRMVALDDPLRRPYAEKDDLRKYSQHELDAINTRDNAFQTLSFGKLANEGLYPDIGRVAVKDDEAMRMMADKGIEGKGYWILTLDSSVSDKKLVDHFRKILKTLEDTYQYPVEIEFTVNFTQDGTYKINLLQCRPLQTKGVGQKVLIPAKIKKQDMLFESSGYFLGGNISQQIKRVIFVDPEKYTKLALSDKYEVARIIGALNRGIKDREQIPTMLMGPGRWGTTTPSLGVPVKFAEINNITILSEVAFPAGNLMPELSYGTHFFQDLVETNIFYLALFPEKEEVVFNEAWFAQSADMFEQLMPQSARFKGLIGVYDASQRGLKIMSDVVSQRLVCFSGGKQNI